MLKYHNNISDSVLKMVLRNVTVQTLLKIVSVLQFQNHLWYRMVYIVIFDPLVGIPCFALLNCAANGTYGLAWCMYFAPIQREE